LSADCRPVPTDPLRPPPLAVTRAEAGQQKRLLLLDRAVGWEVAEQLPLDLGPRYFAAAAVPAGPAATVQADGGADASAAAEAGPSGGAEAAAAPGPETAAGEAAAGELAAAAAAAAEGAEFQLAIPTGLRAGDRLLLTMPAAAAKQHAKQLRRLEKQGVLLELFTPPEAAATPRLGPSEGLAPLQLWQRYAAWQRLPAAAAAAGADLLTGVLGGGAGAAAGALEGQHTTLAFEAVEVEGYFRCGCMVLLCGTVQGRLQPPWALVFSILTRLAAFRSLPSPPASRL
jgi:hypothetical protein